MGIPVPKTLSALTLAFAASGCSDAQALADAYEKVCKANCECPEEEDNYGYGNEDELSEKNCKKTCRGYSIIQEAYLDDQFEDDSPCGDLKKIAKDIKNCAKKSCGDSRNECLFEQYSELSECIGDDGGYYYYDNSSPLDVEARKAREIRRTLTKEMLFGAMPNCQDESAPRTEDHELI